MDTQSTGASDPDIQTHGEDQDRRGIDVAGRHLVSNAPVFGNAGESSPTVTTDPYPERLRTPELPPSGLAPQGTRPEGSVVPGSKSVAAPSSPEAGNGQVVGGRHRHIWRPMWGRSTERERGEGRFEGQPEGYVQVKDEACQPDVRRSLRSHFYDKRQVNRTGVQDQRSERQEDDDFCCYEDDGIGTQLQSHLGSDVPLASDFKNLQGQHQGYRAYREGQAIMTHEESQFPTTVCRSISDEDQLMYARTIGGYDLQDQLERHGCLRKSRSRRQRNQGYERHRKEYHGTRGNC